MAWIESHQKLERHPKTIHLMSLMGWELDSCIGKLHRFWWWCVDYAEDGDLRRHNDTVLASAVGLNGDQAKQFVGSMIEAGWLDREPYFRVHDWWDYIGLFLRRKYEGRNNEKWERVRKLYYNSTDAVQPAVQKLTEPNQPNLTNQPNQPGDPPLSGQGLNGSHLGKSKKKKAKSKPAPLYQPEWVDQFWNAYPNPAWRPNLNAAFEALNPDTDLFRKIMDGLDVAKSSEEWARDNGKWIPHPAKFISGRGWENKYTVKTKGGPLL